MVSFMQTKAQPCTSQSSSKSHLVHDRDTATSDDSSIELFLVIPFHLHLAAFRNIPFPGIILLQPTIVFTLHITTSGTMIIIFRNITYSVTMFPQSSDNHEQVHNEIW